MNQILEKLCSIGYEGSRSALRHFLEPYRANKKKKIAQTMTYSESRMQLSHWIWKGFETLKEEQE